MLGVYWFLGIDVSKKVQKIKVFNLRVNSLHYVLARKVYPLDIHVSFLLVLAHPVLNSFLYLSYCIIKMSSKLGSRYISPERTTKKIKL